MLGNELLLQHHAKRLGLQNASQKIEIAEIEICISYYFEQFPMYFEENTGSTEWYFEYEPDQTPFFRKRAYEDDEM